MNKPQIVGWELTKSEKDVEMATLPAEQLRCALAYIEELEQKLNKHSVSGALHLCPVCNEKSGKSYLLSRLPTICQKCDHAWNRA